MCLVLIWFGSSIGVGLELVHDLVKVDVDARHTLEAGASLGIIRVKGTAFAFLGMLTAIRDRIGCDFPAGDVEERHVCDAGDRRA